MHKELRKLESELKTNTKAEFSYLLFSFLSKKPQLKPRRLKRNKEKQQIVKQ